MALCHCHTSRSRVIIIIQVGAKLYINAKVGSLKMDTIIDYVHRGSTVAGEVGLGEGGVKEGESHGSLNSSRLARARLRQRATRSSEILWLWADSGSAFLESCDPAEEPDWLVLGCDDVSCCRQ